MSLHDIMVISQIWQCGRSLIDGSATTGYVVWHTEGGYGFLGPLESTPKQQVD